MKIKEHELLAFALLLAGSIIGIVLFIGLMNISNGCEAHLTGLKIMVGLFTTLAIYKVVSLIQKWQQNQ
tara:strand:+ start:157 stop:363 length:207 start_codon:yes stop_codon:yes gene_type:complete